MEMSKFIVFGFDDTLIVEVPRKGLQSQSVSLNTHLYLYSCKREYHIRHTYTYIYL